MNLGLILILIGAIGIEVLVCYACYMHGGAFSMLSALFIEMILDGLIITICDDD